MPSNGRGRDKISDKFCPKNMIWKTRLESGSVLGNTSLLHSFPQAIMGCQNEVYLLVQLLWSKIHQSAICDFLGLSFKYWAGLGIPKVRQEKRSAFWLSGLCSTADHWWGPNWVFYVTDTCFKLKRALCPPGSMICIPLTKLPLSAKWNYNIGQNLVFLAE